MADPKVVFEEREIDVSINKWCVCGRATEED
jgi:hypothetical protein